MDGMVGRTGWIDKSDGWMDTNGLMDKMDGRTNVWIDKILV